MSSVFWLPVTILQLTKFGPCKRIESTIHPSDHYCDMIMTPPCSLGRGDCCLGADNIILHVVATVHRVRDICLCQEYEVVFSLLGGTNRLWEANIPSGLNVVHPQVDSHGVGNPVLWRRRRQVKGVTAMLYWWGEKYGHHSPLTLIHLKSLNKV